MNLKRSDSQYVDIERFNNYELTNNIIYEMAIRNIEIQELVKNYIQNNCDKNHILGCSECQNIYSKLMEFFINPYYLYTNYHFFSMEEKEQASFNNEPHQYIKKEIEFKNEKITNFTKKTNFYSASSTKGIKKTGNGKITSYHSWLTPIYSRPQLILVDYDKKVRVELDLSMPKTELIDFIDRLKVDYDKNNKTIKSISELLGKKLSFCENDNKGKYPKKPNSEKFADWFFAYDLYKILKTNTLKSDLNIFSEIDLELIKYHNHIEDNYYSNDTYRLTILPTMRSYIENLKYKQLLT